MKKQLILLFGTVFMITVASAQTESMFQASSTTKTMYKAQNPGTDVAEIFEVTATTGAVFSASNTSDGTAASYKHSLRISIGISTKDKDSKIGKTSLVFYTEGDNIPYAAAMENGVMNIYYPRSMYESIKEKLDQYLLTKKKIQLKVTLKADGFREASLIF